MAITIKKKDGSVLSLGTQAQPLPVLHPPLKQRPAKTGETLADMLLALITAHPAYSGL